MVMCGMVVQRKKEIESKVFDLRVRLEDQGYNEEDIVKKEKELRAKLSDASTSIITRGRGYVHLITHFQLGRCRAGARLQAG